MMFLPSDLIFEILFYLTCRQDIISLCRVNRTFNKLLNDYLLLDNIRSERASALMWAARYGHESVARRLIQLGANVNTKFQEYTATLKKGTLPARAEADKTFSLLMPLHMAVWAGNLAIVKLFLEKGASLEAEMCETWWCNGWTPLFVAFRLDDEEMCRMISNQISKIRDCFVNSERKITPLHVASYFGVARMVSFLLDKGVDIDARDSKGLTPLYYAMNQEHQVLDFGHRKHINDDKYQSPDSNQVFETVKTLVRSGADVSQYLTDRGTKVPARELQADQLEELIRELFQKATDLDDGKSFFFYLWEKWELPSSNRHQNLYHHRQVRSPEPYEEENSSAATGTFEVNGFKSAG